VIETTRLLSLSMAMRSATFKINFASGRPGQLLAMFLAAWLKILI
jgi:hypothetical protein